jgi:hypothetical protein
MNLGLVEERLYQTLMRDREAHTSWISAMHGTIRRTGAGVGGRQLPRH